jgi:NAD(P)H-dependent flavin oxidoreductase YrpB (nitropropane dioxygenase family)
VGTAFAFCRESGFAPALREQVLAAVRAGRAEVHTDPNASPTGFPFKVVNVPGSLADEHVYARRPRRCDVGLLRVPFVDELGRVSYRCPAEPERVFQRKRGLVANAAGRRCLCNGLLAAIGLGQVRDGGAHEPPIVTAGDALLELTRWLPDGANAYGAADVVATLLGGPAG